MRLGTPPSPELADHDSAERADYLIVCPLEEELAAVLRCFQGQPVPAVSGDRTTYYRAHVTGLQIVILCFSQMGPGEAAVAVALSSRRWRPRAILLVGIAGGNAARGVALGDVLIADQIVAYGEEKRTASGTEPRFRTERSSRRLVSAIGRVPASWHDAIVAPDPSFQPRRHLGTVLSGWTVEAAGIPEVVRRAYPRALGVEMEGSGAALAVASLDPSPEFLMIRGVSDLMDAEKQSAEEAGWRAFAADAAAHFAHALIHSRALPERLPFFLTSAAQIALGIAGILAFVVRLANGECLVEGARWGSIWAAASFAMISVVVVGTIVRRTSLREYISAHQRRRLALVVLVGVACTGAGGGAAALPLASDHCEYHGMVLERDGPEGSLLVEGAELTLIGPACHAVTDERGYFTFAGCDTSEVLTGQAHVHLRGCVAELVTTLMRPPLYSFVTVADCEIGTSPAAPVIPPRPPRRAIDAGVQVEPVDGGGGVDFDGGDGFDDSGIDAEWCHELGTCRRVRQRCYGGGEIEIVFGPVSPCRARADIAAMPNGDGVHHGEQYLVTSWGPWGPEPYPAWREILVSGERTSHLFSPFGCERDEEYEYNYRWPYGFECSRVTDEVPPAP